MAHFPSILSPQQTDASLSRIATHFETHGWGVWAVEIPGVLPFAGCIGLSHVRFEAPFTPAVEIGWRLVASVWGNGYAGEGARAALAFGFESAGLREVVSFTAAPNIRSQRVMQRLGMTRDAGGDFDHPDLPVGHPLRRHLLYRADRDRWSTA